MRERYRREGGLSSLILQGFCVGAILVRRDSRQLAKPGVSTSLRRLFAHFAPETGRLAGSMSVMAMLRQQSF